MTGARDGREHACRRMRYMALWRGRGGGLWTLDVTGPVEMGGQWEDWRQESALALAAFWPIIFVIKKSKN